MENDWYMEEQVVEIRNASTVEIFHSASSSPVSLWHEVESRTQKFKSNFCLCPRKIRWGWLFWTSVQHFRVPLSFPFHRVMLTS
jgi:hypothetical protein